MAKPWMGKLYIYMISYLYYIKQIKDKKYDCKLITINLLVGWVNGERLGITGWRGGLILHCPSVIVRLRIVSIMEYRYCLYNW